MANEFNLGSKLVLLNGLPVTLPTAVSDPGSAVAGDMYYNTTTNTVKFYNGTVWQSEGTGSVTSVALTAPAFLSVTGSPITSSGTLALSYSGTALPVLNGGTGVTSLASLTAAGTDGISVTGGSGAVIVSTSIAQQVANTTQNGYLSSTDWNTFNGKGNGTVTSVTFTGDGTVLSSTPSSAVTASGTLSASLNNQNANLVLAGPASGGAAAPTFRSLASADLSGLMANPTYINSIALSASISSPTTIASLTFAYATYGGVMIDYEMVEATTLGRRIGTFVVATDGTNVGYSDEFANSIPLGNGIILSAVVNGANINIQYTGTGSNAVTMRASIKSFNA